MMSRGISQSPRRVLASLAGLVLGVSAMVTPAAGQEIRADDLRNVIVPQHRVVLPEVTERSVRIESIDVSVAIRGQVASTTVTIQLRNPLDRPQESRLLMPVPDGATVRQFRLEGLPNEGLARVLPREEARRIYESIVRRTRDPGLIEFVGLNLIQSSVFPVPADGTQRMELVYEQILTGDGERVDYALPRSESLEAPHVRWSFSATIESDRAIGAVYSPSHALATERRRDGSVRITVPDSAADNPGAFRLSYVTPKPEGIAASVLAYPDARIGEGGYFMLLLGLPEDLADGPTRKREVTLVLDRSGSMREVKLEQAKEAAIQIIGGLSEGETFNIVDYADMVRSFSPTPVIRTGESLAQAEKYLEGLAPVGGTNIHDALVEALGSEPPTDTLPMVLFLTDGRPTVGIKGERDIREAVRRANLEHQRRIFSFGVGFDVNSPLLNGLASTSKGSTTFVLPDEDIEAKVGQVFERLQGPVLLDPELTFESVNDADGFARSRVREVLPGSIHDVFEGEQIMVFGQYLSQEPIRMTLGGTDGSGRSVSYEIVFDPASASVRHSFVPRIWASRKIGSLIEHIRSSGADGTAPDQELVDEVIRLSTEYGILTEYTAFLAAEENEFVDQRFDALSRMSPLQEARQAVSAGLEQRWGREAVSQELNSVRLRDAGSLNLRNDIQLTLEDELGETSFVSVRQNADMTLYRRGERWLDVRLLDAPDQEPDRIVEFASDEYFELAARMAREGRQAALAVDGDVFLVVDGARTLIRAAP